MDSWKRYLERLRVARSDAPFREVKAVCDHYFGKPRTRGSHHIYTMPWGDDPRINIQDRGGRVARYQVKQVLRAVDRKEDNYGKS